MVRAAPLQHRPWRGSVRARIALACGALFLVIGGVLIAGTYALVGHLDPQSAARTVAEQQGLQFYRNCQLEHGAGINASPDEASKCRTAGQLAALLAADAQQSSDRRQFLLFSLAGLTVATLLAGLLGWAAGGRVLSPLRAITEAARSASQENLDRRLALAGPPDELKELADTFDGMLSRLDAAFASQRRFVANASHELRTPLTEMRTLIDVAMAKPTRSAGQLETVVAGVRTAVDKSDRMIEALLTLARSDRGLTDTEVVDLPTAVEDAADSLAWAAAAGGVTIELELEDAQLTGDRLLIERMIYNLVDNAIRYNLRCGTVAVTTTRAAGIARLTVVNTGEQIDPSLVPELFRPFRRLTDRVGSQAGSGLGLSIVASVAAAHGGTAAAEPQEGGGLRVTVSLPDASHPRARRPRRQYPEAGPGPDGQTAELGGCMDRH